MFKLLPEPEHLRVQVALTGSAVGVGLFHQTNNAGGKDRQRHRAVVRS